MSEILTEQIAYYRARATEYDEWWHNQGRYDKGDVINQQWRDEGAEVRAVLHKIPKQAHILELASGTGIWTQELLKIGEKVTCVDASPEMIAINQAKVQSERVDYIQADLFTWQSEQQYDMIFFSFWLSHVPSDQLQGFLKRVSTMLKPDGILFLVDSQATLNATASNQTMRTDTTVHQRILNDGREFKIIKVFYEPNALQSELEAVNIVADVHLTKQFFIYAQGRKATS